MIIKNMAENISNVTKSKSKVVMADGTVSFREFEIVTEHYIDLYINNCLAAKMVCSPEFLVELVVGRMTAERIISSCEEIVELSISKDAKRADVTLADDTFLHECMTRETTTSSANHVFLRKRDEMSLDKLQDVVYESSWIFNLVNEFSKGSKVHKVTKGAHSCMLAVEDEVVFACEDIGRHNALDKVIGYVALNNIDKNKCLIYTSGRVPTDMANKMISAGFPVLVSKAVPTDKTLELARKYNLTLICRAWPDSYEICE